jgi:hypothetical protein
MQFTSNIWSKLCEMLHTSHRQTTAYHLKDALRTLAATVTWSKELPFVLLGLHAQLREDIGHSLAEAVFGTPIVLPNKFLQGDEFSVDEIVKN